MQQTEIETALAEILENITGTQPAQLDRALRLDKLGLDSLSKIDLAVGAEDRFGIAIPDEDLERFVDFGDLLNYLHRAIALSLVPSESRDTQLGISGAASPGCCQGEQA